MKKDSPVLRLQIDKTLALEAHALLADPRNPMKLTQSVNSILNSAIQSTKAAQSARTHNDDNAKGTNSKR